MTPEYLQDSLDAKPKAPAKPNSAGQFVWIRISVPHAQKLI
jgi:hypothetical protein